VFLSQNGQSWEGEELPLEYKKKSITIIICLLKLLVYLAYMYVNGVY